jgi:hypothetical protein
MTETEWGTTLRFLTYRSLSEGSRTAGADD